MSDTKIDEAPKVPNPLDTGEWRQVGRNFGAFHTPGNTDGTITMRASVGIGGEMKIGEFEFYVPQKTERAKLGLVLRLLRIGGVNALIRWGFKGERKPNCALWTGRCWKHFSERDRVIWFDVVYKEDKKADGKRAQTVLVQVRCVTEDAKKVEEFAHLVVGIDQRGEGHVSPF